MSGSRSVGLVCLVLTATGWGVAWLAAKTVLQYWPPLFVRGSAGVGAAIGLAVLAHLRGERLSFPRAATGRLLISAGSNVVAWMGLSTMAMRLVPVSEGALLVYSMPIWATVFAWLINGDRPTARGVLALVLGIGGVGIMLLRPGFSLQGGELIGVALALSAAILFALGTVTAGPPLPLAPIALTAWLVGLGCLPMVLAGVFIERPDYAALSAAGWVAQAYLTVVAMGLCYLGWFAALRRLPASTAATGMLLVPIVGSVAAALALGEPLGVRQVVALVVTLAGVTLALRR